MSMELKGVLQCPQGSKLHGKEAKVLLRLVCSGHGQA